MSAGICVMNKNAVALSADSAVTVNGGEVIHNSVNKLFSLSKNNSIGLLIYSSADFMTVPLEIIIKQFKLFIDENNKIFFKVKDCVSEFFEYLVNYSNFLHLDINEMDYIIYFTDFLLNNILKIIIQELHDSKVEETKNILNDEQLNSVYNEAIIKFEFFKNELESLEEYDIVPYINENYGDTINNEINSFFPKLNDDNKEKVKIVILDLFNKNLEINNSCIVFAGYGKDEIYPSMIHINLYNLINKKVKFYIKEEVNISEKTPSSITPLAQKDVMEIFLFGISNDFINYIDSKLNNQLEQIQSLDDSFITLDNKVKLKEELKKINKKIEKDIIKKARDYFLPVHKSIANLPIDELSMLAESMVNLTSFRRKVAIDNYSRTVGGPIDVAVISKGDGFIWTKRKHYFKSEENPQYFHTHYNNLKG